MRLVSPHLAVLYHGRGQEGGTTGAAAGGASGGAAGAAGAAAAAGDHPADDHLTRSQAIDILAGALAEACASAGTGAAAATVAVGGLPPPCAAGGGAARQRLVMPPPIVDLRDPQVVFVCECVPAAGGRLVVGLSLLPVADLMAVKPKLNVRALAAAAAAAAPKQKAARGD